MSKKIIIPTVALFVICLVCTLLLALANNVTDPLIKELAVKTEMESRMKVLDTAATFEDGKGDGFTYATGYNDAKEVQGYVFVTTTKSYGGELQIMTGIDTEGKVTGVEILTINDTVGLGMNAKKEEFRNQFKGLFGEIAVQKNSADPSKNEIQALTGATISSKAVTTAVNMALENYAAVAGNGGAN